MNPAELIDRALTKGRAQGLAALEPLERMVFLISEAEVYCDMEGIDSFLDRYGTAGIEELARAYHEIGAAGVADAVSRIVASPHRHEHWLASANELITGRVGYSHETIELIVARHISGRQKGTPPEGDR